MLLSSFAARCVRAFLFFAIASGFVATVSGQTPADSPSFTIFGTPPDSAIVGQTYTFQPAVYSPAGRPISFGIYNSPSWLTLDAATGRVSGVPAAGDLGTFGPIILIVTDGLSQTMYPFSVAVDSAPPPPPPGPTSITLSWTPPTENTDLSPLVNLAGYRIYYGPTPGSLTNRIDIANPGIAAYVVDNLASGLWYFTVSAYNADGIESMWSEVLSQLIQ